MISGKGSRRERGWGGGGGAAPHFLKKKTESLMEKEYSTGGPRRSIQIDDWSVSILYHKVSTRGNEVPYSLLVSLKTTFFTKLHLVVDFCVFTSQVM